MDQKRVFETELTEGKDLSGSSKRSSELSTLLNTLHTAASSKVIFLALNSNNLLKYEDVNRHLLW